MIFSILRETITITGFVLVMMLLIEYINVFFKGNARLWKLSRGWRQYLLASTLGALPGCIGSWATVTLYSHGLMSLGALTATMVATCGDESFMMLALMPQKALWLFAGLLAFGVVVGVATDVIAKRWNILPNGKCAGLQFHPNAYCGLFSSQQTFSQWKRPSPIRITLTLVFIGSIALMIAGYLGPEEWNWMRVALIVSTAFALFVVGTVPDHFLEKHLWGHVVRKHAFRVFAWMFGALVATYFIVDILHLDSLDERGKWMLLAAACLVGIIPQSGPHLVFLTLYVKGAIPMSILVANSIVQDGHGMLPLLAESRRAFVITKTINVVAGALAGALLLGFGF